MNVPETCSAYRLGKAKTRKQLHADGTSRRQVCITSLVVRIKECDCYVPIVTIAHFIALARTTGGLLSAIEDAIDRAGTWVTRFK